MSDFSHVRIDAVNLEFRFYKNPVDITRPLCGMREPYYKTCTGVLLTNGQAELRLALASPTHK